MQPRQPSHRLYGGRSTDEMVSTTADIARNCESAATVSDDSKHITLMGMDVVRTTLDQIRR